MPNNTKERSDAIQAAARALLIERQIDIQQQVAFRPLAQELAKRADCHYDTAKRHVAKAVRRARGELAAQWGGTREGAGYPRGVPRKKAEYGDAGVVEIDLAGRDDTTVAQEQYLDTNPAVIGYSIESGDLHNEA